MMIISTKIKFLFSLLFICSLCTVSAEIIVIKTAGAKQKALDNSDKNNYLGTLGATIANPGSGTTVFDMLIKYQWPTSLLFPLAQTDKNELYSEKAHAEKDFIKKKVQEKYSASAYDVIEIPNTVYQLFVISHVFANPKQKMLNNVTKYLYNFFANFECLHPKNENGQEIGREVVLTNQFFSKAKNIYENSLVAQTQFEINNALGNYYVSQPNKDFKVLASDLIKNILKSYEAIIEEHNKIFQAHDENKPLPQHFLISDVGYGPEYSGLDFNVMQKELINGKGALNQNGMISKMIDTELQAFQKNKAVLVRGTGPFYQCISDDHKNPLSDPTQELIDSPLRYQTYENLVAYYPNNLTPRGICYNLYLLVGVLFCKWDSTYDYASKADNYMYALFINKQSYAQNQCENLFIMPPFSPLTQIFGLDSMYHALVKIAFNKLPEKNTLVDNIDGFEPTIDEAGILFIERDPVEQAQRLADFISKNAVLLKISEAKQTSGIKIDEEQTRLLNNMKQASGFYSSFLGNGKAPSVVIVEQLLKQLSSKLTQLLEQTTAIGK